MAGQAPVVLDFGQAPTSELLLRLRQVMRDTGCFLARHPLITAARCAEAVSDARAFFDLPNEVKHSLATEHSRHFRGYSVMHNDRDWREQIHFGRDQVAQSSPPQWAQLIGPNQWPLIAGWRNRLLALMADLEMVGREIVGALAMSLGLLRQQFLEDMEDSYPLLKLIHYHPCPSAAPRPGVAPHVDFSWITLLIQDDAGGLEIRTANGTWTPVPPHPGTIVVHAGEVLQFASGGYFRATPHRVVSSRQGRISLPFFLNPALARKVEVVVSANPGETHPKSENGAPGTLGHVHRVFSGAERQPFIFGDEEWRRKGQGVSCTSCFHAKTEARDSARSLATTAASSPRESNAGQKSGLLDK